MLCYSHHKIRHIGIFIFFSFFLSFSFSFFCFSSNSFATSVSCSRQSFSDNSTGYITFSDLGCDVSSLDSSVDWYYQLSATLLNTSNDRYYIGISAREINNNNFPVLIPFINDPIASYRGSRSFTSVISDYHLSFPYTPYGRPIYLRSFSLSSAAPFLSNFSDVTLIISDSIFFTSGGQVPSGSLSISENGTYDVTNYAQAVVDVPPEIVQGDYHDDLLRITQGIYICAGVMLVLYFFYCIYRLFIKGSRGSL